MLFNLFNDYLEFKKFDEKTRMSERIIFEKI